MMVSQKGFFYLFLFLSLALGDSIAQDKVATVVKSVGLSTQLLKGEKDARSIHLNDFVMDDSSLLTGNKSNLQIQFTDSSFLSLASNSKAVINYFSSERPIIISLYKGKLRIKVSQSFFYVKTRWGLALLKQGDYLLTLNNESRTMIVLNFKGESKVFKLSDMNINSFSNEIISEINRDEHTNKPTISKTIIHNYDLSLSLDNFCKKNSSISLQPGQLTVVSDKNEMLISPFLISPIQLEKLYENLAFDEKKSSETRSIDTNKSLKSTLTIIKPEISKDSNIKSVLSGGFLDLNTGFYISPKEESSFSEQTGVYDSVGIGSIDEKTGQYISPEGFNLTNNGFELASEKFATTKNYTLLNELNESLINLFFGKESNKDIFQSKKYLQDRFSFLFSTGQEKIKYTNSAFSDSDFSIDSKSFFSGNVDWRLSTMDLLTPIIGVSFTYLDFKDLSSKNISYDSKKLFGMSVGVLYSISNYFDLFSTFQLRQEQFFNQTSISGIGTYSTYKLALPSIDFGLDGKLLLKNNISFDLKLASQIYLRKKFNDLSVSQSFGYLVSILGKYQFKKNNYLGLGSSIDFVEHELKNSLTTSKLHRSHLKFNLNFNRDF